MPAQARRLQLGEDLLRRARPRDQRTQLRIGAVVAGVRIARHCGQRAFALRRADGLAHARRRSHARPEAIHHRHRRRIAATDAGHALQPHLAPQRRLEPLGERAGAGHRAGQRLADPHGQRPRHGRVVAGHDRSGDRSSRPRRPRPATGASTAASAASIARERPPSASWIRCRCSISRSRRFSAPSPSTSASRRSACASACRPLGRPTGRWNRTTCMRRP